MQPTHVDNPHGEATQLGRSSCFTAALLLCVLSTGCTSIFSPVSGVPAHRLPPEFLAEPKNDLVPVDISRLRQQPPRDYLVGPDDVLGIYIAGILGDPEEPPPVNIQQQGDVPPSIGYPIPVREDGTLSLPLVPPIQVEGLTLTQIENLILRAYTIDSSILQPDEASIVVTLMKKRTYRVVVMRQDGGMTQQRGGGGGFGGGIGGGGGRGGMVTRDLTTRGHTLDLEAYKNDVMHALAETGGLPGQDVKNEIQILRSSRLDAEKRDAFIQKWFAAELPDPCLCRPPLPDDPAILRIPLRLPPGEVPQFTEEDIILEDGDIVLIEGREREVFYTGGLLGGGEWPLPRDYDLDVLGAMAIVGQGVASPGGGAGGRRGGGGGLGGLNAQSFGGVSPGQLFILRKTPCDGQIIIAVDLNRATRDPKARPLIQPEDVLVLQHKPGEELLNFGLGTFFTFGISELLRN